MSSTPPFRFLVYFGNNSELVRKALLRRPNWEVRSGRGGIRRSGPTAFAPLPLQDACPVPPDVAEIIRSPLPPITSAGYLRALEQRKRAVEKWGKLQTEVLLEQRFNFVWRPTLRIGVDDRGAALSLHSCVRSVAGGSSGVGNWLRAGTCGARRSETRRAKGPRCRVRRRRRLSTE